MRDLFNRQGYLNFCTNIYGLVPTRWIISKNIIQVPVERNKYILYNRILNRPVLIDGEAKDFYENHYEISKGMLITANESDVVEELIASFIYMPEHVDEIEIVEKSKLQYLSELATGAIVAMLDLRVSEACNFGCSHCIAGKAQTGKIMSTNTAIAIAQKYICFLQEHNRNIPIEIHFGIAEPLINYTAIKNTILHLEKDYPNAEFKFSINTNLSLLNYEIANFFKKHSVFIHASIDGLQIGNDQIRTYKDGSGTYNIIAEKIKLLYDINYPLQDIGITITTNNLLSFSHAINELADWCKVQSFLGIAFDFDLVDCLGISAGEQVKLLNLFSAALEKRNIDFYGTWLIPIANLFEQSFSTRAYGFCKGISGYNFSVDADNNLFFCSCSSEPLCSFNEIETAILPGGEFYEFVKHHLFNHDIMCSECEIEGACNGFCEITRSEAPRKKYDELCEYLRSLTKQRLILLAREGKK